MAVSIRCPNPQCGGSYDVRESDLGRSFRCSRCGQKFRVSAASCATARPGTTSETAKVEAPRSPEGSPQKLGRFEIRSRLGAGAFGAVYRAYDPVLDREVALKVPHAGTLQTDQDKARFLQEAKAAGKLRHPNIVPVYDAGAEGDQYFIAAAFIEGETLEHRIECRRPKLAQTVEIVIRLAEALDYAHRSGIVHRDIKPANTMLDAVGEPLLMDFGLARFEEHQSKLTQDGTVMGTPLYMPPEQAAGQHALVGPASDQYSLGVVLYELICGQTPFSGPPGLVISLVLHEEPPRPRSVDPRIPKDLETICLKAMSKDRQHRYESCGAMAEELRRFRAGEPILARPIGPAERLWRWCRRNPVIATLSATAALLLLAVAIVTTVGHIRTSRALATAERHRRSAEQSAAQEAMERQRTEVERRRAEQAAAKEAEASELAKAKQKEAEEAAAKEAEASELAKAKQKEAEEASAKEAMERQRAEQERDRAEANAYSNRIAAAHKAWLEGDIDGAERMLDACPIALRHWEWGYLKRQCHRESLRLPDVGGKHDQAKRVAVAFSPDGARLVTAVHDRVQLWDATTGKLVSTVPFPKPSRGLGAAAELSPDGAMAAADCEDHILRVIRTDRGEEVANLIGLQNFISALAYSRDGNYVAAAALDGPIKVYHIQSAQEVCSIDQQEQSTKGLAFSPDNKLLVSTYYGFVKMWDVATGEAQSPLDGVCGPLDFSHDGMRCAAAATKSGQVRVWDVGDEKNVRTLGEIGKPVIALAWSPARNILACGDEGGIVRLWNVNSGAELLVIRNGGPIQRLAFSANGMRLAAVGRDVKVWEFVAAQRPFREMGFTNDIDFSPDGRMVVAADGSLRAADLSTGEYLFFLEGNDAPPSLVVHGVLSGRFSPSGKEIATACVDKAIRIWEVGKSIPIRSKTNQVRAGRTFRLKTVIPDAVGSFINWTIRSEIRPQPSVAYKPDGKVLASVASDRTIRFWNSESGAEEPFLEPSPRGFTHLAFSPQGDRLAAAGSRIQVWDLANKTSLFERASHLGGTTSLVFSPDGKSLVNAGAITSILDAATGQELVTLAGRPGTIMSVAYSDDGRRIATAGEDKTVRLWDATSGVELLALEKQPTHDVAFAGGDHWLAAASPARMGGITIFEAAPWGCGLLRIEGTNRSCSRALFSPDGRRVASWQGRRGMVVYVRDAETGLELTSIRASGNSIHGVAFSPDGERIAVVSSAENGEIAQRLDLKPAIQVHYTATGRTICTLPVSNCSELAENALAFSPDGTSLACAFPIGDRQPAAVNIWDIDSAQRRVALNCGIASILSVAFCPDGNMVAIGLHADSPRLELWDLASSQKVSELKGHSGTVHHVRFSDDGKYLVSAAQGGAVKVWDIAERTEVLSLEGYLSDHNGFVATFTPDMKNLVMGTREGTLEVWQLGSPSPAKVLTGHREPVTAVAFTSDGSHLLSTDTVTGRIRTSHERAKLEQPG